MENIILQVISVIVQAIIPSYFVITISSVIQNKDYDGSIYVKSFLVNFIISFILVFMKYNINIHSNLKGIINIILTSIFMYIISYFILYNTKLKSILLAVSTFLFFSLTEFLVMFFGITFLTKNRTDLLETPTYSIALILLQMLLAFFITYGIKFFKMKRKSIFSYNLFEYIYPKQIIFIICTIILCVIPQLFLIGFNSYNYSIPFLIINCMQMIIITIVLFKFIHTIIENNKTVIELTNAKMHNQTLEGLVDGIRKVKHDFNNFVQSLSGYVATKEYDSLDVFVESLIKECKLLNNLSLIDPKIINEPALYGIISSKYFFATEQDIDFDLDILTNAKEINFSIPDLSRIMGILLDNAIEATLNSDKKYIKLEMRYDDKKCADVIRVSNTYNTDIKIDLDNVYKKGYSSKKVKSGIGLWEVKGLISRAKNSQIYPSIEKGKFMQNIIIEKMV